MCIGRVYDIVLRLVVTQISMLFVLFCVTCLVYMPFWRSRGREHRDHFVLMYRIKFPANLIILSNDMNFMKHHFTIGKNPLPLKYMRLCKPQPTKKKSYDKCTSDIFIVFVHYPKLLITFDHKFSEINHTYYVNTNARFLF